MEERPPQKPTQDDDTTPSSAKPPASDDDRGAFWRLLRSSPLVGVDLDIERDRSVTSRKDPH
jgi:hypothetical protein